MSTEKKLRQLPSTDEAKFMASGQRSVEQLAGTVLLDRYRLIELVGSGGAAAVYRAEHVLMHKVLAVKILRPELALRQDFVQRFLGEARTVARLRHENIVDIVDIGRTESGIVFTVMEHLEGEELADTIDRDGPMPWARARDIVLQVCNALAAAHAAGIVHRDIKPSNCFRVKQGTNPDFIKLLDFGIAKETHNPERGLTATGVIIGTPEYMSPEQSRGQSVDQRSDIYSVGVLLFELLAGRVPFEGETFVDVILKQMTEPPPRLSVLVTGLHPAIDAVVTKALAKQPEERYATIDELMASLMDVDTGTQVVSIAGAPGTSNEGVPRLPLPGEPSWPAAPHTGASRSNTHGIAIAIAVVVGALLVAIAVIVSSFLLSKDDTDPTQHAALPEPAMSAVDDEDSRASDGDEPTTTAEAPPQMKVTQVLASADTTTGHASDVPPDLGSVGGDEPPPAPRPDPTPEVVENESPRASTKRHQPKERKLTVKEKYRVAQTLREACLGKAGFQEFRVTVDLRKSQRKVTVSPVFAPLQQCLAREVKAFPDATDRLSFVFRAKAPPPPPSGSSRDGR